MFGAHGFPVRMTYIGSGRWRVRQSPSLHIVISENLTLDEKWTTPLNDKQPRNVRVRAKVTT